MPRARNIKPGFYLNDELAQCSVWARLIFPGLWMLADREGKLEDRPLKIKAALLPYDTHDMDALLGELHDRGFVVRYSAGGGKFIAIVNFGRHQNPHCKEPPSIIPDPPAESASPIPAPDQHSASTGPAPDLHQSSTVPARLIPDSGSLIPDCGLPESGAPPRPAPKRFTPPTVADVAAYCRERGNTVDPAQFVDFYESKGWKVGSEPMRDWKASMRTWERRDGPNGRSSGKPAQKSRAAQVLEWAAEAAGEGQP